MNTTGKLAVLGLVLVGAFSTVAAQDEKKAGAARSAPASSPQSAAEKAIRAAGAAFVRAYNAGNSNAIAALFTPDAEVISEDGHVIQGRPAIAALFAATFEANPGETIEIEVESLRVLDPNVVKEEGRARIVPAKGKPADQPKTQTQSKSEGHIPVGHVQSSRYTVLYVLQDGRWLQSSVREHADPAITPHAHLEPLSWLLGEWVDEAAASVVSSNTRWSDDGNFLLRDFTIQVGGKPAMKGTQRIGWDPRSHQIKSWVFDSEGGHGEALWSRDGNRWIVKAWGVLHDGRTATATQVYTVESPHLVRWKSVERTVGGQIEPDSEELVMVRKPPRPR
jgi:uncharacterized protein (TIGR02246 family)